MARKAYDRTELAGWANIAGSLAVAAIFLVNWLRANGYNPSRDHPLFATTFLFPLRRESDSLRCRRVVPDERHLKYSLGATPSTLRNIAVNALGLS
jgi:hypothetical protein